MTARAPERTASPAARRRRPESESAAEPARREPVQVPSTPRAPTTRERLQAGFARRRAEAEAPSAEPELAAEPATDALSRTWCAGGRRHARTREGSPRGDRPRGAVHGGTGPAPRPEDEATHDGAPGRDAGTVCGAANRVIPHARGPPGPATAVVQPKLAVSQSGDPFEREAEACAHRVVHGGIPSQRAATPRAGPLQRAPRGPPPAHSDLPPTVRTALQSGGGRPLDPALRARIEPHVGMDLGHVRVRDGPDAAAAARDIGAFAFTSGATIFLAAGSSPADLGLLAHESAHVAQQATSPAAGGTLHRLEVTDVIPDWILDGVRDAVRALPGYEVLTAVVGQDPLTGEPASTGPEELVETLLTYGPFGAAVGPVLSAIDVLGDVVAVLEEGLRDNDLTLARVGRDLESAWDQFTITNGIAGNLAIVERLVGDLLGDVGRFVAGIADRVIELVRAIVADVAEPLLETPEIKPLWDLAKKVLRYDPLRGEEVQAETVDILADFLVLVGEEERLAQMQERGTLQETADWLDVQLATFAHLVGEVGAVFTEAWEAIQPENLPDLLTTLPSLATRVLGLILEIQAFEVTLILKVLELVKASLLGWLSDFAADVPGYALLTFILEQDPFTGAFVERTAYLLIRGFITLMPGGAATFDQLAETGVIDAAAQQVETAMARLGISLELVTGLFASIWDELTLDDLLDPIGAFVRILALFGEPLGRLVAFVGVVIEVVVTLILRLLGFPTELLASVIANAMQAIDDIAADPVGFLLHMLEAVKLGFERFFEHIGEHLLQGLADWLFRGIAELGIQLPPDLSFGSILTLVLDVLGLSVEHLWEKLAEHIDPDRVALIQDSLEVLTGVWSFIVEVQQEGLPAIWRFIADQLGNLWTTVLGMATEWIMTRVIIKATTWLLGLLDPTFIMSVVNGFIQIFAAIQSAVEYFNDLLQIFAGYVETLAAVAAGNVEPGAQMLERGLVDLLPVAIGFLARQLGIGNIPYKIAEIVGAIRETVDAAIDWLIEQALRLGQAMLDALGGRPDADAPPEAHASETQAAHDAMLEEIVPKLVEDTPSPEPDDARWFAGKQRQAEALEAEYQPRLEEGVRVRIQVATGAIPRQLLYDMDIAPNTTTVAGATVPPVLTKGERYTFFENLAGREDPVSAKHVDTLSIEGRWIIVCDAGEARQTEARRARDGRPLGHGRIWSYLPAYRKDKTQNFRQAGLGGGENPVFRPLRSRSTPNGVLADEVEAEPLALTSYSSPRADPPGLGRIRADLRAGQAWVAGHLVNGEMGGPGSTDNLVPITGTVNAQMRGNYENRLRAQLELGKYYYFHAKVGYHARNAPGPLGRKDEFVESITVSYQEIVKAGAGWTRVGSLTVRPPYQLAVPPVTDVDPARVSG